MAEAECKISEPNLSKEQDNIPFFKDFLSNEKNRRLITVLRSILGELRTGLGRSNVFFIRVKSANCNSFVPFNKAALEAEVIQRNEEKFPIVVPFVIFFLRGYAILESFLDSTDPSVPCRKAEQQALKDLLHFLTNRSDQSALIDGKKEKQKTECEAALVVRTTQQLLVPLAPHKTFVIDSYPGLQLAECCAVQHSVDGNKGDTSFGCAEGWHGRADIMLMDEEIPFAVVETPGDEADLEAVSVSSDSLLSSDSSVEEMKVDNFSPESIAQATAQGIVNSFVQHKKNPKSPNSLVPGFGICSKKMIVSLYDCVEDILIQTGCIDLYTPMVGSDLNLRTVIMLWLGLNHGIFGNKTPEKYKSYSSNLHGVLGPLKLEAYYNKSDLPFKAKLELDSYTYFEYLNQEVVDSYDDAAEYITDKMRECVSLK